MSEPPEATIEGLREKFDKRERDADYLAWMSYIAFKTKLVEDYLQRLDKMGMRHSVEGRVPLLDPSLATWACNLPQDRKVPDFREKTLLRRAVAPILPQYVLDRPKQGFCPPVATWCERILSERPMANTGLLFDSGLLNQAWISLLHVSGRRQPFALWTLGLLLEWSRLNLRSANVADVAVAQ